MTPKQLLIQAYTQGWKTLTPDQQWTAGKYEYEQAEKIRQSMSAHGWGRASDEYELLKARVLRTAHAA